MSGTVKSALIIIVTVLIAPTVLNAEPSWARKYNAACTLCHTTYPRLNRTGYEFKRLGYRLPREVESRNLNSARAVELQPAHKPNVIQPSGYTPNPQSKDSESGHAIYERLNCTRCHAVAEQG